LALAARVFAGTLAVAAIAACGAAPSHPPSGPVIPNIPVAGLRLPALIAADSLIVARHPIEAAALATPGGEVDGDGLIGRNRQYGQMVSPRLQLGAGAALRIGLHGDAALATNGFRAIEAGVAAVAADGTVISKVPPDAPAGATLSIGDSASGAAFFMADACPAVLARPSKARRGGAGSRDRVADG
jgi:hypothetical protein